MMRCGLLAALMAAPAAAPAAVWINELHYDNSGTDSGEAVEIAGDAGTSLAGWSIQLYNGADGAVYATHPLSGSLPATCGTHGVAVVATPGMQNGSPDGIALVDGQGRLVQFLSYEGSFRGKSGPARRKTSTDIGEAENGTEALGLSLQLAGTGTTSGDFVWMPPHPQTFGACNADQSFPGMDQPPAVASTSPPDATTGVAINAAIGIVFDEPVAVTSDFAEVLCDASGAHAYAASGGPEHYTLDVMPDFTALEHCSVRVFAARVTDLDGTADAMLADHVFTFQTQSIGTGYYSAVDASTPARLRTTLHDVIDDHRRYPYTSTATDTWDILEFADEDPLDAGRILDVYKNASYQKYGAGNTEYNREHTWPKSYGFTDDGASNYPYTDTHMLFLSNSGYNSSRGNKPYANCTGSCSEYVTLAHDGTGGGSGTFPGNSNWANTSYWQTWGDRKGDVARAVMYMDVRYAGGHHGVTGAAEPDLVLTDNASLIAASSSNLSVAYMGLLSHILQWHQEDPVDEKERLRNEAVYSYQGNRNPFIDHPEWAACLYQGSCP